MTNPIVKFSVVAIKPLLCDFGVFSLFPCRIGNFWRGFAFYLTEAD